MILKVEVTTFSQFRLT